MDPEISFGDVQQAQRQRRRRPDENKHYAVVRVFQPDEDDLRIYVDIDALRDMEAHALSNTNVELGGVMLGGQYEDEEGRPFVVVTDSLRAQHYESTKGSFKFTHDTWSQITRERDEFPDELQMVGWYHTHPDWGVFLSGMDMFICDNFFNKPLDVALVIDPCRDDRGFFQWTGDPGQRVRRTGGFYLIGSRFRAYELEDFAARLEGVMARDSRVAGYAGAYPAPVVNIADRSGAWQAPAVMAMMTLQFALLVLLAWRILAPPGDAEVVAARDKTLETIARHLQERSAIEREQARLEAQREVLDQVVGHLPGAPQGVVTALEEERLRNEELRDNLAGQLALVRQTQAAFRQEQSQRKRETAELKGKLASAEDQLERLAAENKKLAARVQAYREKYEPEAEEGAEGDEQVAQAANWTRWALYGAVAVVFVLVIGGMVYMYRRGEEEEMFSEEAPPEPNPPDQEPPQ